MLLMAGNTDELSNEINEMARKAVKAALEEEQPIRPVVQNVIEKTVEHVVDGTPEELRKLAITKTACNLAYATGACGLLVLGTLGACAAFRYLGKPYR